MKTTLTALLLLTAFITNGQEFEEKLDPFNKLIVDPYINVELVKGNEEKIQVFYDNVDPEEIISEQRGKTLHLYLADAKIGWRLFTNDNYRYRKYRYAEVKMVITYKNLKNIQFRGEEQLTCDDEISGSRLKLKAYGETDIRIASMDIRRLKIALYGENSLLVSAGNTYDQTINTYGENRVDASMLKSYGTSTKSFGENKVSVNASEYIRAMYFGEGELRYSGHPIMERKWLIGEVDVRKIR